MGFTTKEGMVRVDIYKAESGKWGSTTELDMAEEYFTPNVYRAVRNALAKAGISTDNRIISVVKPYHEHAFPVLLTPGRASYTPYPEYERI